MNTPAVETARKPITLLWIALQKMTRLRDGYSRDRDPAGRLAAARTMAEMTGEIRTLADNVLAEAERDAAAG
ncbi:MAG: hypothetical protein ACRC7O_14930 [Fimbriiglobus sp.]